MPKSKREELLKAARNYAIKVLEACEEAKKKNLTAEQLETHLNKAWIGSRF
jgi:hypothetical protein